MNSIKYDFINNVSSYIQDFFHNISPDVADFIGCQFALECAYGHSSLAQNQRNYCGMKTPLVRISTAINAGCSSSSDQYAKYDDLYFCIIDYILWLQYQRPLSVELNKVNLFASILGKVYCRERDYVNKIQSIYQQFKSYKNECTKSNSEV